MPESRKSKDERFHLKELKQHPELKNPEIKG